MDERGNNLMMSAAQFCATPDVAARLIECGVDVDLANKQNFTPLQMAFVSSHSDTAHLLVDHGVKLTKKQAQALFFEGPLDTAQRALVARATQAN